MAERNIQLALFGHGRSTDRHYCRSGQMKRTRRRGKGNRNPRGGDRAGGGRSSVGGHVRGAAGQGNPSDALEARQGSDAVPPPFHRESTGAGSSSVSPSKNANEEVGYSRVQPRETQKDEERSAETREAI